MGAVVDGPRRALGELRADGTLKKLEQQWLSQTAGAPVLQ